MDYKTSAENYCSVVGIPDTELAGRVRQSITIAMKYRHEKGTEVVTLKSQISDQELKTAVEDQDYVVTEIF